MKYIQTNDSVTAHGPKGPLTINASHPRFREVCVALATGDFTAAVEMMSIRSAIKKWSEGGFVLEGDTITFRGESLPNDLADRIVTLFKEGNHTFQAFANFWARLQKNPSYRSVNQLWAFIKAKNIPLNPDGHFYAYKAVNNDWMDCHSNSVSNRPGTLIWMDRNKISDDAEHACHYGYHVGNKDFVATNYGGKKVVICLIDPADVVCVPKDSSGGKMRVCRYLVLGERAANLPSSLWDHVTQWSGYLKTKAPDVSLENFNGVERDLVAADHLSKERIEIQMPQPPTSVDVEIEDDDELEEQEMPESVEDGPTASPFKTLTWGDDLKSLDLKALRKLASGLKIPKAGKLGSGQLRTAIGLAQAQAELLTKAKAESAPVVAAEREVAVGVDWGTAEGSVSVSAVLVNQNADGSIASLDTLNREKLREIAKGLGIKGCMKMTPAELRVVIRGVPSVVHGTLSGRTPSAEPNQANEPKETTAQVAADHARELLRRPELSRAALPSKKAYDTAGLSREKLRVIAKELGISGCMGMSPDALRAAIAKKQG